MNLMKLFNLKYLKENLKKSKVTLAFVLLILPILNLITFLMSGLSDNITIFDLGKISILTILGMYILPIVLSITLFSFVFKKKSVDFMGSMPIDRKTLFFTNTLGGIIIIVLLLFITSLLVLIASSMLPNVYVPFGVLLDYLSMFIISYIFVFTACNIGVSIAGNIPTTLVVTALILFFIPFSNFAYNNILRGSDYTYYELNYQCKDCTLSENIDEENDIYYAPLTEKEKNTNYTMPFEMISQILDYDSEGIVYDISTIGIMSFLSLIYILVGYLLFEKREMEICETSFKNFKTHQIVKYLTFIPILVIVSKILEHSSLIALIFVVCLLIIYNFVYDLITRHSIIKVVNNFISFSIVFVTVIAICLLIMNDNSKTDKYNFMVSDIDKVSVNLDVFNNYSNNELININDSNIKQKLIDGLFINYMSSYKDNKDMYHVEIGLLIEGKYYETTSMVLKEDYKEIEKYVKNTIVYKNKNLKELLDKKEIITLGHNYIELDKNGLDILKQVADKKNESSSDFYIPISIYLYKNHKLKEYTINSDISPILHKYVVEFYNEKAKNVDLDDVYAFNVVNASSMNKSYHLDGTVLVKSEIKKVMKEKLDFNKEVYRISIFRNGLTLYYYANLDEGFFDKVNNYTTYEEDVYYGY